MITPLPVADTPSVRRFGALQFLSFYVALLFTFPASLVLPGLGALGSPATLLGIIAFGWWCAASLTGQRELVGPNSVRAALFCYLGVIMLSWTIGKMRSLTPLEASTSDRAILSMLGLVGIALVAIDGIRTRAELETLVRRTINFSMVMVFVGMVQFFFDRDLTTALRIPGLELNADATTIGERSNFARPHGTTLHAIEYGVVSAALVPLAYWIARSQRSRWAYLQLALLAFAAMTSLSRSAVLAFGIVGIVLFLGSGWTQRITILVTSSVFVVLVGTLVNGLVGTLRSLFTSADNDPSVQARIDRIPKVLELISEYPWFGRGFGTYTPEDYFLLDNEIQKTAIESGLIGVAVLLVFIGFVAVMAWRTRIGDELGQLPGVALVATIFGLIISSYTFDAFFYRILTGVLYLCIGLVGAMYRLTADDRADLDALTGTLRPPARHVIPVDANAVATS